MSYKPHPIDPLFDIFFCASGVVSLLFFFAFSLGFPPFPSCSQNKCEHWAFPVQFIRVVSAAKSTACFWGGRGTASPALSTLSTRPSLTGAPPPLCFGSMWKGGECGLLGHCCFLRSLVQNAGGKVNREETPDKQLKAKNSRYQYNHNKKVKSHEHLRKNLLFTLTILFSHFATFLQASPSVVFKGFKLFAL